MKRFILLFTIIAIIVSLLVLPASASGWNGTDIEIIDFLDYVDRDHMVVDGENKYVLFEIPATFAVSYFGNSDYIDWTLGEYGEITIPPSGRYSEFICYPTQNIEIRSDKTVARFKEGFVFDVSMLPKGASVYFDWVISALDYPGTIGSLYDPPDFRYTCYFWGKPDSAGWSYKSGRSHIGAIGNTDWDKNKLKCIAIYEHGYGTVGTATNYIAPTIFFNDIDFAYTNITFSLAVSSIRVEFPITDDLISIAQNEKTQKLLDEVNSQLEEQGKTMDDILSEQQQTNDKLDGVQDSLDDTNDKLDDVHGAIDDTNDKLDGITDYEGTPERPDWQDSVDDLEDVEQGALDNVETGMEDADKTFSSALNVISQYAASFAGVTVLFNTFADMPFFSALLSIALSLGIVAAILGIGIDAARSSSRASSKSKKGRSK